MNKNELTDKVAEKSKLTKTQADMAINALIDILKDILKADDKITFKGFGTFEVRDRGERMGRNPKTGEPITISAKKIPVFKASSSLKNEINN